MMMLALAGCKKVEMADIIDDIGVSQENVSQWSLDISYISETRGTGDRIYTTVSGDSDAFIEILNSIYVSQDMDRPNFIFSAEAMCEYRIDIFHTDKENPELSFYYLDGGGNNMLTSVIKSADKDSQVYVDYQFYSPGVELPDFLQAQRAFAYEPKDELAISFVSRAEMISSISQDELVYYVPEAELEDESANTDVAFEFYEGIKPDDGATNAQVYSNRSVETLSSDQYLIVAKTTSDKGAIDELSITEVRFNEYYTLVFVTKPDIEFLESMGVSPNSAITISKDELPIDKWVVFLDENDEIVDVINPDLEMQ